MTNPTITELATRVEEATGPDRELDAEILRALGWVKGVGNIANSGNWYLYGDSSQRLPIAHERPTASLDAAMQLVPEGWRLADAGETIVDCSNPWAVRLFEKRPHDRDSQKVRGDAATFALALTAACLRALSQKGDE